MQDVIVEGNALREAMNVAARYWPMTGWVTDDTYQVTIGESGGGGGAAQGELRNPDFPDKVGANESWQGTIDGYNIGNASGTFRFKVGDKTSNPITINPGQGVRATISGTGPCTFTIEFQRQT